MPYDRFLIAPFKTGLETDLRSWQIPEDAFESIFNAYVFRGRIRKRPGSYFTGPADGTQDPKNSRMRINIGTTDGAGAFSGTASGAIFQPGQTFTVGNAYYTVTVTGTPGTMLATQGSGTFNTTSGAVVIAGAPINTIVYFYPSQPIMGIWLYETHLNNRKPTYVWDTQFAYEFDGTGWQFAAGPWHGGDLNFFDTAQWQGTTTASTSPPTMLITNYFVTNKNGAGTANDDFIWMFNGTTWTELSGFFVAPVTTATTGPFVVNCRIIVAFKGRTILLNTTENDGSMSPGVNTTFANRMRWSAIGSPFVANAWYEPNTFDNSGGANSVAQGAGYADAPTEEEIISAEFIKDRLVVFFRGPGSTWEIVYTGNEVAPFRWQKINTELGSIAQQSTIPHDKFVLTTGNTGVHACTGANVERIDQKIPDEIFTFKDDQLARTAGIRDYPTEVDYWAFTSETESTLEKYPNRILSYNYQNNSWAIFEDSITSFGYWEQVVPISMSPAQYRQVLAGNAQGYVFIVDPDTYQNATVMYLTNVVQSGPNVTLTIYNHTLQAVVPNVTYSDYIFIENSGVGLDGIWPVASIVDANTITIGGVTLTGTYKGGATIARVSNPQILSKQWNPYVSLGRNLYLFRIDFAVLATTSGQLTVDYYPSSTQQSMLQAGATSGALAGTGILETTPYPAALAPLEQFQTVLWHPIYFQSYGEFIQTFIYLTTAQIQQQPIAFSNYEIQGIVLHTMPTNWTLQ